MKNIKISLFCIMMITATTYCFANEKDKDAQPKTDTTSENTESKETTNTTFIQNILDAKNDKKTQEQTDQTSDDAKQEQRFITKEKMQYALAAALILFTAASIKFKYFPSAEQKRLHALNGRDIGITGMSTSFESFAVILLSQLLRQS